MQGTVMRTPGARPRSGRPKAAAANGGVTTTTPGPRVFVPHYPAGVSPLLDLRPTPVLATGLSGAIAAKINAFSKKTGNGRWKNLPRAAVASRLTAVAGTPSAVDQDGINACGPALAMYLFAREKTEEFVDCAIALYDSGRGRFGKLEIRGDELFNHDPIGWNIPGHLLLDWMLLSSLRRTEDNAAHALTKFDGSPDDGASGITWPSEMEKWLRQGVGFSKVSNRTSALRNQDLDDLEKLDPQPGRTVVLLINVTVLGKGSKKGAKKAAKSESAGVGGAIMTSFPDHYCELEKKVAVGQDVLIWSWGTSGEKLAPFAKGDPWEDAYFGYYLCEK